MAYFIDLFSPETYDAFARSPRDISGFRLRHKNMAQRIKVGDVFVCYLTRLSRWFGLLEVIEGPFINDKPIFVPENDPFVVRFRVHTAVWLDIEKAIPCGLIVNELVSNALKHAFPNGGKGRIQISLEPVEQGQFVLKVRDNGRGFPKDFEPHKAQSLGLQMVHLLADQLGGSVEIVSREGAAVDVAFPVGRTAQ